MARALAAGSTDYSHQSLDDILSDLDDWSAALRKDMTIIATNKKKLEDNNYWELANTDFKWLLARAVKFYETSLNEIVEIREQIPIEVESHHVNRLRSLGNTSHELNLEFGDVWHHDVRPKDYGESNFMIFEKLYIDGRELSIDMEDLSNVAARLEDFVGRKGRANKLANNINVNIGRDFSGNLIVGDDNEAKNES
jgi:hypothetical protein